MQRALSLSIRLSPGGEEDPHTLYTLADISTIRRAATARFPYRLSRAAATLTQRDAAPRPPPSEPNTSDQPPAALRIDHPNQTGLVWPTARRGVMLIFIVFEAARR